VKGTLNVVGENSKVTVASGGTYILEGEGTNEGNIIIEDGGVTWGNGGNMEGTGFTVVQKGAKAYVGGNNEANRIYAIGDSSVTQGQDALLPYPLLLMAGTDGSLSFNNTYYELEGEASINGVPNLNEAGTNSFFVGYIANGPTDPNNRVLTLKEGSKLSINGGDVANVTKKVLGVVVYGTEPGIKGETGAQIILEDEGYIDIYAQTGDPFDVSAGIAVYTGNISGLGHNFYSAKGSKEASNGLKNKTYTWDEDADSDGNSGWVAGSNP
jgi:hypothetical protein